MPDPVLETTLMSSKPILKTLVIPFIIKQLYPLMSLTDYSMMKEEKSFLNQTTFVCEDCFLCITMSSECSGVKIIVPPNPEKIIEAKKRELAIQARHAKKNMEVDPLKDRKDVKRKDKRTTELSVKYSVSNLADTLVNKPAGKGSMANLLKKHRSQSMNGLVNQANVEERTEFSYPDGEVR